MTLKPTSLLSFLLKKLPGLAFIALICLTYQGVAKDKSVQEPIQPKIIEWVVAGKTRKALVYIPATAKSKPTPVIFLYHGHGGTMQNIYNTRGFEKLWPEAITICPQGLNTVGQLTDPQGNLPGWQMANDTSNTDLQFFDAMLNTLKTGYMLDTKRIYVTGHSNGGGFTYLLWAARGDVFAAVAPTAAVGAKLMFLLKPKPALHLMGETDPLVKPAWQKLTCNFILKLNKCEPAGQNIAPYATLYKSATGNPFIIYSHPGGHTYPPEANAVIIDFFKQQMKP